MNLLLTFTSLAYSGIIHEVRLLMPLVILAGVCLVFEVILVRRDIAFSQCWWFFFATVLLVMADLVWSSWTVSTPMAEIINYGENSLRLILSIAAYLLILGILLIWSLVAGIRQVVIEAGGSGWGWALARLAPAIVLIGFAVDALSRGNAAVGGEGGLIGLIRL